ncbi:MAG TPA: hypothetical protein VLY04_14705 [Bryobacteraceae bacterium]|nr:hypothetical protein [Bryobacteraceae bacterium]
MTCPFLKETQVKYCRSAAVRKLIPLAQAGRAKEKCSSGEFTACPVYQQQREADARGDFGPCPYLHESLMQYCAAAATTKFVPYSESLLSRCGNDSYRYCELYLAMAHPNLPVEEVDSIPMPSWLQYSANHMWLDATDDGLCHAGIDAFLARALGPVDRISYVWQTGHHRPTAVLTAAGIDWEVVFPNAFQITRCNLYLRATPGRLTAEPYSAGWLFEGKVEPGTEANLLLGDAARQWMEEEHRRINDFLQQQCGCAADGGTLAAGCARHLDREQMLALFHEFFSRK